MKKPIKWTTDTNLLEGTRTALSPASSVMTVIIGVVVMVATSAENEATLLTRGTRTPSLY